MMIARGDSWNDAHCVRYAPRVLPANRRTVISHRDVAMLAPAARPFNRSGWIFELKYDGFRYQSVVRGFGSGGHQGFSLA